MGEEVERDEVQIASYKSSHGDVKDSTGNIANNIVITMKDIR